MTNYFNINHGIFTQVYYDERINRTVFLSKLVMLAFYNKYLFENKIFSQISIPTRIWINDFSVIVYLNCDTKLKKKKKSRVNCDCSLGQQNFNFVNFSRRNKNVSVLQNNKENILFFIQHIE